MKTFFLAIITTVLSAILFNSCSKKSGTPPPIVQENPEPLQIEKTVFWRMSGSDLISDTFHYRYDESGRLISTSSLRFAHQLFAYTDGKIFSIKTIIAGDTSEIKNFATYSANGDTILFDYTGPGWTGEGTDTALYTYYVKNGVVTNYLTYVHDYIGSMNVSNRHWVYNNQGNLMSEFAETMYNLEIRAYEVIEWDDKINPMHGQPVLNSRFMSTGLPLQSFSVHNPIKYKDDLNNLYEVEMTYNTQGYPLTVKFKNENFISAEIFYNR